MNVISRMWAILIIALLIGCGGGESHEPPPEMAARAAKAFAEAAATSERAPVVELSEKSIANADTVANTALVSRAAKPRAQQPLETSLPHPYGGVPPEVAAEGFLNNTEWRFSGIFPVRMPTQVSPPFRYRCYFVAPHVRCVGVAINVPVGSGLIEGGAYTLGVFEPRTTLFNHWRLIDWYTPPYPHVGPFAVAINPPWYEQLSATAIGVNVVVNANQVIRMAPNGYPYATIHVVGPNGYVTPTIFQFRDDHEALALRFTASAQTSYTATFVLQNNAGQVATAVVPFTTPP